jgi:hypothetical protein
MKERRFTLLTGMEKDLDEKALDHHVSFSMAPVRPVDQPSFLECPNVP